MKCVLSLAVVGGVSASQIRGQHSTFLGQSFQSAVVDGAGYDAGYYSEQCDKINSQCEERIAHKIREYEEDLEELKAEWTAQQQVLSKKEAHHADEKADVPPQAKKVSAEQKDVQQAKKDVAEHAHCPPDLKEAEAKLASMKSRLSALEANPNKTPADVDEECELKKKILEQEAKIEELKACIEKLRAAERVLAAEKDQYHDEKGELADEQGQESEAASAVPPQKAKVADAKAAYEAFKRMGVRGIPAIKEECQSDRDALERKADADIRELEDEYSGEKRTLGEKVDTHQGEKADVVSQQQKVEREQKDVVNAKEAVKEHEHCPPELEDAKAKLSTMESRLSALQANPNKTPADVDEECELKKKILVQKQKIAELEACVEQLRAAQAVLAKESEDVDRENAQLSKESAEERDASQKVPPQKRTVAGVQSELAAAKEARKSICHGPDDKPAPVPAPAPKKEAPKSGAEKMAVATSTAFVVFAVLLSSMQA
jgi:chromosome segregation ATPase